RYFPDDIAHFVGERLFHMPSVAFFRLTARSVLCVCMERNSLPNVPGTDNSHNRRRVFFFFQCMSPLLALSGYRCLHRTCPLLGVKRTCGLAKKSNKVCKKFRKACLLV